MTKEIQYNDADENPYIITASGESNVIISGIDQSFKFALVGTDGVAVEYEVIPADGGPLIRPHRPR